MSFHITKENSNDPVKTEIKDDSTPQSVVYKINQRLVDNDQKELKCVYKDGDIMIESKTEILYTVPFNDDNKYITGFNKERKLKYLYVLKDDGSQKIIDYHQFNE